MSDVFLISGADRVAGVRELFQHFDTGRFRGSEVVVKANYNSADPPPGSTHIDTLRGVIQAIGDSDGGHVTLIERSGMGTTRHVLEKMGVDRLSSEMGFRTITLEEMGPDAFVHLVRPWMHWRNGFWLPKLVTAGNPVVSVCCLKTHRFGGHITMSLKNSVGLIAKIEPGGSYDYMRELHMSSAQRMMIAEINTGYFPDLVVLDAMEGFSKGGPERGELIVPGVLIAGSDRVAVDATGVAILRKYGSTPEVMSGKIFQVEQIRRAAEIGAGVSKPSLIHIKGLDAPGKKLAEELAGIIRNEG
jgi:uncharacterized protein (DUF362 family)